MNVFVTLHEVFLDNGHTMRGRVHGFFFFFNTWCGSLRIQMPTTLPLVHSHTLVAAA